jgi:hypothetical protein
MKRMSALARLAAPAATRVTLRRRRAWRLGGVDAVVPDGVWLMMGAARAKQPLSGLTQLRGPGLITYNGNSDAAFLDGKNVIVGSCPNPRGSPTASSTVFSRSVHRCTDMASRYS